MKEEIAKLQERLRTQLEVLPPEFGLAVVEFVRGTDPALGRTPEGESTEMQLGRIREHRRMEAALMMLFLSDATPEPAQRARSRARRFLEESNP